jgi:hypothetical protein
MKKALFSPFLLSFALSCLVQLNAIPIPGAAEAKEAPPRVTKSDGIERAYVPRAQLTGPEEKVVIALARKQGVEKVAKISTYNIHPSAARGIRVQGVEQVRDREVSYQVLTVNYRKWFHPGMEPRKGDVRMGDFWAGKPYTRKQTILRVGKTDYRCSSLQGLSFKEAESMLGLFLAGKFTYNPGARINERLLAQVDWNKPSRFSKRGDAISVGFPHKGGTGSGFFDLEVQFEGGKLTIKEMFQAIP